MAATRKRNPWWVRGDQPALTRRPIAATQGAYVLPNTPMYVCQAGTVKLAVTADGTGDVLHGFLKQGVSAELASATVVYFSDIRQATEGVWAIYTASGDADSAAATSIIGDQYGIGVGYGSTVGYCVLDLGNANAMANVVGVADSEFGIDTPETPKAADSPGISYVQWLSTIIAATVA